MQGKQYILIGGGLAGMMLAARLLLTGNSVTLFDYPNPNSASRRAAGMFNIITGRNYVKTWKAETLRSALTDFFELPELEGLKKHLSLMPVYKPFKNIEEYNHGLGAGARNEGILVMNEAPVMEEYIHNPFGGMRVNQCGWLDTPAFLEDLREILESRFSLAYYPWKIETECINLNEKKIRIHGETFGFEELVLCQGAEKQLRTLWELPVIPCKGQTMMIEAAMELPFILSGGVYILPAGPSRFTVGATYEWEFTSPHPTPEGRESLCTELQKIIRVPYTVISHFAGIRPTTHDRRPLLGTHPVFPFLHVFSGFGTKGILMAPYFSGVLSEYLSGKKGKIEKEYDILRYYRKEKLALPQGADMRSIIRKMSE